MGYRSQGVLGIKKDIITRCTLLEENIPGLLSCMIKHAAVGEGHNIYYSFDSIKMYSSYPDVAEFYAWLQWLSDECEEDGIDCFGYLEIGEDGDSVEEFGDPAEFGICHQYNIDSPVT